MIQSQHQQQQLQIIIITIFKNMLKQTSKILLTQIKQFKKFKQVTYSTANEKKIEIMNNNNTIKVDFIRMSQSKISQSPFTQCSCGALLIDQDSQLVKKIQGSQLGQGQRQGQGQGRYRWYCRFCRKQNIRKQVYYSRNGFKTILQKNTHRSFLPPIILFLIDISGSMGQSIAVQSPGNIIDKQQQQKMLNASNQILQIIKNSFFQQKQHHKLKQLKQKFQYGPQKELLQQYKSKNNMYFSNITLFMGIIQNYVGQLRKKSQLSQFRIGFVFFNQEIYIMKAALQKTIPIFVSKHSKSKKQFPFDQKTVDFDNFQLLFNEGKKFDRFFGDSKLKNCDMQNLKSQNLNIQGQTALGPALAIALGIISCHDIGSRIVLVSDAMPNMGILAEHNSFKSNKFFQDQVSKNKIVYDKINKLLNQKQATLGVLSWITQKGKTYQQKLNSQFGEFLRSNKQRIKEITLDFSLRQGQVHILNTTQKILQNLINRGTSGRVISAKILTSNSKVSVANLNYDDLDFRHVRFLGIEPNSWIQLDLNKISQEDLLFPIYTQLVITYQDILTKQKHIFMSYIKHKIISTSTDKFVYQSLDQQNKNNLKQLEDLQKLYNFDKNNVIPQIISSRNLQMISSQNKNSSNYYLQKSLNQLAELQRRRCEADYDDLQKL